MTRLTRTSLNLTLSVFVLAGIASCAGTDMTSQEIAGTQEQSQIAHDGNVSVEKGEENTSPDYELVFPDDRVNEIVITISPENYEVMMANMTDLYGEFGSGETRNFGDERAARGDEKQPFAVPEAQDQNKVVPPDGEQQMPAPAGDVPLQRDRNAAPGGQMMMDSKENPEWIEATITFNNESWEHVGIRYKGNSSLKSSWSAGNHKLPFKLDFDQFEDIYSETQDQRFYGFKQLSFASNFFDSSYLHELIAADVFRDAGVPSAQTAFYAVYFDCGEGPVYYGLYTAVEVVDDTVIETQFSDDSGNVYKPSGTAATFAEGTFNTASMDLETNLDDADYSDIEALYATLHADDRISDPEKWRNELEEVFDVDGFLRWLATNTLIQNWDTYGGMSHNFYLYHDPESDRLVWIPWDNNEALQSGRGRSAALELDMSNVGENWPLIRYLIDDEVYFERYTTYLNEIATEVFTPERMEPVYTILHDLIAPYVQKEQAGYTTLANTALFENSVETLMQHTRERYETAVAYLQALE